MIKFSGIIPKDIQKRVIMRRRVTRVVIVVLINFLLIALVCVILFTVFPKAVPIVLDIWGGTLILEIAPHFVILTKPDKREVCISDRQIAFSTSDYLHKGVEIDLLEVSRVTDFGEFYLLQYEKGKREIICVKELLAEGTLDEFESRFKEVLVRKTPRPRKKARKRKAKDEELPLENAVVIFDGTNSFRVMGDAELHENRKTALLFFFIAAIFIGAAIYNLVLGTMMRAVARFLIAILFFVMGALFWNLKQPGLVPPRHRIVITNDTIFDAHLILGTVRKLKVKRVRKVVDRGTFFEIRSSFLMKSIVCEKSLLIKGTLDDFEKHFQDKLKT